MEGNNMYEFINGFATFFAFSVVYFGYFVVITADDPTIMPWYQIAQIEMDYEDYYDNIITKTVRKLENLEDDNNGTY
jgi:hypothetical protein